MRSSIMMFLYIVVLGLVISSGQFVEAAAFEIPSATSMRPQMSGVEAVSSFHSLSETSLQSMASQSLTSLPPISRVTPPPSLRHLDLRQRCWNDQGFSVNCAVWTGYRYTWGPSSNPYDYWSGNGGSGSGGGNSGSSNAVKVDVSRSHAVLLSLIYIWAVYGGVTYIF